jgi:NADH-quinone oxidoreductase subunit I
MSAPDGGVPGGSASGAVPAGGADGGLPGASASGAPVRGVDRGLPGGAGGLAVGGTGGRVGDVAGGLPPRSRGVIGLLEENCTVCMLCARECPDWCIYIESHTEPVPEVAERGRPRTRHVLDRFAIDFSLCMYCGICVEACPYDALFWSPEYAYPEGSIESLTHESGRLREWMWTVPPPPAHDPGAPPPREAQAG